MVINCDIKFDNNPLGIYFAGQNLSGAVEIRLERSKKVGGICLKICGFACTNWTESENYRINGKKHTRSVVYSGRADYLNTTTYLLGSPQGPEIDILPGVHTYSFACLLPQLLPSSFEGKHGHVRYTVKVVFERPWKFDLSYKVAFTVLKQLDLNYDNPDLRLPVQAETMQYFCCWPCKSGPLSFTAIIPMAGFVPGQSLPVSLTVDNQSRQIINEITFKLKKIIKYSSQTPKIKETEEKRVVVMKHSVGVPKYEKKQYQHYLHIPAVPPTNMNLCKIIQISYVLKIKPKVSGMHKESAISIPITIGTVPLTASNIINMQALEIARNVATTSHIQEHNSMSDTRLQSPVQIACPEIICTPGFRESVHEHPEIADLAPPSYEESMYGSVIINDADDVNPIAQKPFTPRYPVYHFSDANQFPGIVQVNQHLPVSSINSTEL